ncbi:MAG: alpha-galactosidase [Bacteroidales bacterium]|nr:alpha-galactosidase [Bacteroidales bacterium]
MRNSIIYFAAIFTALLLTASCDDSIKYEVEHTPTMGMSFWNAFQLNINEDLVKDQALAVKELGYADAGYKFINIDDGFQMPRDADGNFRYDPSLFPNGMRAVADYIHSLGLKAGIYTDAGDNTCGSENKYAYGLGTGLYGHEVDDCKLFFDEWDYDFIKIDFCGGQNAKLDEREQYTRIAEAIRACDKQDIIFNICRWRFPGTWAADLATSWRTTYDIRPWFSRVKYIIDENLYLQAYTRNGHYNDCDMLEIGSKWPGSDTTLSHDEELTHMAYWCIASSPLIMGCDMRKVPESSREVMLNADLIAMNQDKLGLGAPVVQKEGEVYVVAKDMERIMGPKRAVVVMNLSEEPATIDVSLDALGFKGDVKLYDCFSHKDVDKPASGIYTVSLQPHASAAFFATGKRLEKSVYQAEESYMNKFSTIEGVISPSYLANNSASQGMYVSGLGNDPDNWMQWDNVYSRRGGKYVATVRYASAEASGFTLSVNGNDVKSVEGLDTGSANDNWQVENVEINLKKGLNTIRLGNDAGVMPSIDYLKLSKK